MIAGALLAIAVPLLQKPDALQLHGGARAYFESAYVSSSGRLSYTEPVAEQVGYLSLGHEKYGWLATDAWLCSALNGQTDDIHRREFYCYEGTFTYGNSFDVSEGVAFSAWGGMIWDWLGGYRSDVGTPFGWIAEFRLRNPYVTPYLNALGFIEHSTWVRIKGGVNHEFTIFDVLKVVPFLEATWGDNDRYRSNFGFDTDRPFLGGALMFLSAGVICEWTFWDPFYLWGRYRHYVIVDNEARRSVRESDSPLAKVDHPVFGLGIGFRF